MIRKAETEDFSSLLAMAKRLWPNSGGKSLNEDIYEYVKDESKAAFLYFDEGEALGFALLSLRRDYVAGATSSPTGYLEGIYIEPQARHKGAARRLIERSEAWASERGCTELGSDVELQNTVSQSFHKSVGFEERERIVCYIKRI